MCACFSNDPKQITFYYVKFEKILLGDRRSFYKLTNRKKYADTGGCKHKFPALSRVPPP